MTRLYEKGCTYSNAMLILATSIRNQEQCADTLKHLGQRRWVIVIRSANRRSQPTLLSKFIRISSDQDEVCGGDLRREMPDDAGAEAARSWENADFGHFHKI